MSICSVTVVITSYNRPDALRLVLNSVSWQTKLPLSVVVCDDGSSSAVREVVYELSPSLRIPLIYAWQPDNGFRLARSRNLGVLRANCTSDSILFLDGDCILPPNFLERFIKLSGYSKIVFGARYLLGSEITRCLEVKREIDSSFLNNDVQSRKFWKLPLGPFRVFPPRSWRHVRGFLMLVPRQAYLDILGSDERYVGWGLEDSDLVIRLTRYGLRIVDGRYSCAVIHLWHWEKGKDSSPNRQIFRELLGEARTESIRSVFTRL